MTSVERTAPAPRPSSQPDPLRVRAWLAAAIAVLLVLVYLSAEYTYSTSHLPPSRWVPVAPGALGHAPDADFRLLSVRQTERWGRGIDGPGVADPGAVWVVAELEVTPRRHSDFLLCEVDLVATDGRTWEAEAIGPVHEGESCAPDRENAVVGTTYPFVAGFSVPAAEVDKIAGVGVNLISWRHYPLLRPSA